MERQRLVGGLPGGIQNVTWSAAYTTDTPGLQLQWKWGAAVYSSFSADYNAGATATIYSGGERPSYLLLPVIPKK